MINRFLVCVSVTVRRRMPRRSPDRMVTQNASSVRDSALLSLPALLDVQLNDPVPENGLQFKTSQVRRVLNTNWRTYGHCSGGDVPPERWY